MNEKNQAVEKSKSLSEIIFLEVICAVVWLAGIFFFYLPLPESSIATSRAAGEANVFDAFSILLSVVIALLVVYWMRRRQALATAVAFLFGVVFYNTLSLFVEPLVALTISVLLVFCERAYRSFFTDNLLVIFGVFAAAISLAGFYHPNFLLILLGLFAVYDLAGVFWTKTIPNVAKNAAAVGAPLLLVAPKKGISWFQAPTTETISSMFGAGDLFIPLLFLLAVSLRFGYETALLSLLGAVLGNVGNIFLVKKIKTGIPAVPLLAMGLTAGYGAGLLFFYFFFP